ncbi:MAG: PilZ domain-containing protein [Desulfobulbales bacterium]|nr:PilZ domain-containing protein [Desulfobulbales bacterium]
MDQQKAFVRDDGTTILKCPFCKHARTVSVAKVKDKKKIIKVKCTCQKSYTVSLELRKMYRKKTSLEGKFINLSQNNEPGLMLVKDISMGGVGFEVIGSCRIQVEDELQLTFTLDDSNSSVIKKDVVVKVVRNKVIGCEFLNTSEYDKALGFYLMP